MRYQPDYSAAIEVVRNAGLRMDEAERIVMTLIKSGEMVCVPNSKVASGGTGGRKTQQQLSDENAALRDWIGVLIDECGALNYQQYLEYAKTLLRRIYGTSRHVLADRPTPDIVQAADDLYNAVHDDIFYNHGSRVHKALIAYCNERNRQ